MCGLKISYQHISFFIRILHTQKTIPKEWSKTCKTDNVELNLKKKILGPFSCPREYFYEYAIILISIANKNITEAY